MNIVIAENSCEIQFHLQYINFFLFKILYMYTE